MGNNACHQERRTHHPTGRVSGRAGQREHKTLARGTGPRARPDLSPLAPSGCPARGSLRGRAARPGSAGERKATARVSRRPGGREPSGGKRLGDGRRGRAEEGGGAVAATSGRSLPCTLPLPGVRARRAGPAGGAVGQGRAAGRCRCQCRGPGRRWAARGRAL